MPHVIVKLLSGRSEQQKAALASEITKVIIAGAGCDATAVSVSIQDVAAEDWAEAVYIPDISGHWDTLYKRPGYAPPKGSERPARSETSPPRT